jgi:glucosamine-6-phosphate deaminase
MWSNVEKTFIQRSGRQPSYGGERVPVVEVLNIYELGKIAALGFLEWVKANPTGVVALPTGKTPEYFIKTLERYKKNWDDPKVREEVRSYGFVEESFPTTNQLTFVMLDEFFPMLPTHRNSFCNYVQHFYISLLGIKEENVMSFDLLKSKTLTKGEMALFDTCSVDLTLLTRLSNNDLEMAHTVVLKKVQAFCEDYERRLQALGGIGEAAYIQRLHTKWFILHRL